MNKKYIHKNLNICILQVIAITSLILIVPVNPVNAQFHFNSERINQIYQMLPDECINEIRNQVYPIPGIYHIDAKLTKNLKKKLILRINKYYELDHLGLYLINDNLEISHLREVIDYLEREFLVSALLGDSYPLALETTRKRTEVFLNGIPLKNQTRPFSLPKISINHETPFRITFNTNMFLIEWTLESLDKFQVIIPDNYSLITDKTKDELENDLLRQLKHSSTTEFVPETPKIDQLIPYESGIYTFQDETYDATPEFSSKKYFMIKDTIYPVFNNRYYKESISNLFLNVIPTQISLNLTQKLYGGKSEEICININSFFSNFTRDHKIYFGWQNSTIDSLKATIIICNTKYNYTHLLEIFADSRTVFNKKGNVKGLFYAFIPKENLEKEVKFK